MSIKWLTEKRNLSELIPSEYNPRKATGKQENELGESLDRFQLADPIIINKNNRIIGGHFIGKSIKNMMTVCDGSFYICMSSKELSSLKQVFEEAGGHWQSIIIWVKNHFTLSRCDYQNQYESILYGWNNATKRHYFVDDRSQGNVWYDMGKKAKFEGGKTILHIGGIKIEIDGKVTGRILKGTRRSDIWNFNKPSKSEEHPTMKPVSLCAEAIHNSSTRGGIVLDTFLGPGSTLIACEKTNRICYGSEIDPIYCQVIIDRWQKYTGCERTIG